MCLNQPFKITKDLIIIVIGLRSSSGLPVLWSVKNQMVTNATGSKFDKRDMTTNDIVELDVKFSSMLVGYKVYQSIDENLVSSTTIYVAYQMIKENKEYDLCELL